MIKGMTGYGHDVISVGSFKIAVEIKSLNHRYVDASCFLPGSFGAAEEKITEIIKKHIERGRVTISVKVIEKPKQTILLKDDVVKQHIKIANQLKKKFKLDDNLTLSDLLRLPGVLETTESTLDPVAAWPFLEKAIRKALQGVLNMRRREGKSLADDIRQQLNTMDSKAKEIKLRAKNILLEQKKKLLEEEFSSVQKSSDINEELARLQHYVKELKGLLNSAVSVGKKMDFIAQEMQREANTIGSKLQDKVVSNAVIVIKSKIEKIREQSQNVE